MEADYESRRNQFLLDVQATLHSLGHFSGGQYLRDQDSGPALRDLHNFLECDTELLAVRRMYLEANLIQNDLMPIIRQSGSNHSDYLLALRLTSNLTTPVTQISPGQAVWVKEAMQNLLKESARGLIDESFWHVVTTSIRRIISTHPEMRLEEQTSELAYVLQLALNVLSILETVSLHDSFVRVLQCCEFEAILLYQCNSKLTNEVITAYRLCLLLLKNQQPGELRKVSYLDIDAVNKSETKELGDILKEEECVNKILARRSAERFSQFSGSYVLQSSAILGYKDVVTSRPDPTLSTVQFDKGRRYKTPKNKAAIKDFCQNFERSNLDLKRRLRDFCDDFLQDSFSLSVSKVQDEFRRQKLGEGDEIVLFKIMSFFLSYARHGMSPYRLSFVGFCIQPGSFYLVYDYIAKCFESYAQCKEAKSNLAARLLAAVGVLKEMLAFTVNLMCSKDEEMSTSGRTIACNIVYVQEYREALHMLLRGFEPSKMTRSLLLQIVESVHHFLKMIDLMIQSGAEFTIQKVSCRRRRANKKAKVVTANTDPDLWYDLENQLYELINEDEILPEDVAPFDSTLELSMDEQRQLAFRRIKTFLDASKCDYALALLRSCRGVWVDEPGFGSDEMDVKQEIACLRYIFDTSTRIADASEDLVNDEELDEEESDDTEVEYRKSEETLDANRFIMRFAQPLVLRHYFTLLGDYHESPPKINNAILKFLSRLAFDCKYPAFLFQLSLLRTAQNLLNDPVASEKFKVIRAFFLRIIMLFLAHGCRDPRILVEVLFYKNQKIAYGMIEGYDKDDFVPTRSVRGGWSETEVSELKVLFSQACYLQARRELEDDILAYICERIRNVGKTRRQIVRKLVELGLIDSAKNIRRRKPKWPAKISDQLREMFEKNNDLTEDQNIDEAVRIVKEAGLEKSRRQVLNHLKDMGLITHHLRSKRVRRSGVKHPSDSSSDEALMESEGENEFPGGPTIDPTPQEGTEIHTELENFGVPKHTNVRIVSSDEESPSPVDASHDAIALNGVVDNWLSLEEAVDGGDINFHQLTWLLSTLERAKSSGGQLPVIPMDEGQSLLLSNRRNRDVLIGLGLRAPTNQEVFWRVQKCDEQLQTSIYRLKSAVDGLQRGSD